MLCYDKKKLEIMRHCKPEAGDKNLRSVFGLFYTSPVTLLSTKLGILPLVSRLVTVGRLVTGCY